MNPDTPLPEVAHYLSPEDAERLMWEPPAFQQVVLTVVRDYIVRLEEKNACLDPITLTEELHSVVKLVLRELEG